MPPKEYRPCAMEPHVKLRQAEFPLPLALLKFVARAARRLGPGITQLDKRGISLGQSERSLRFLALRWHRTCLDGAANSGILPHSLGGLQSEARMLLSARLDEIVHYIKHAGNGLAILPIPLMLSEAIKRALDQVDKGGKPAIRLDGVTYKDPHLFRAVRARPDFPDSLRADAGLPLLATSGSPWETSAARARILVNRAPLRASWSQS